jgi:hypothetical protein
LRLQLQKGQTIDQTVVASDKTSEVIRGERLDTYMNLRITAHIEVLDVAPSGESTLRFSYKSLAVSENLNERLVYEYDSASSKKVPDEALSFATLPGQSVTLTLSPRAELTSVNGLDAIAKLLVTRFQIPDILQAEMQRDLEQTTYDQMIRVLNNIVLPETSVGAGDTWSAAKTFRALPVEITTKYSLLSQQNGGASVALNSTIVPHFVEGSLATSTNDPVPLFNGTDTGVVELDAATGWPRRFQSVQRLTGRMSKKVAGGKLDERKVLSSHSPMYLKTVVRGWARLNPAPQ